MLAGSLFFGGGRRVGEGFGGGWARLSGSDAIIGGRFRPRVERSTFCLRRARASRSRAVCGDEFQGRIVVLREVRVWLSRRVGRAAGAARGVTRERIAFVQAESRAVITRRRAAR